MTKKARVVRKPSTLSVEFYRDIDTASVRPGNLMLIDNEPIEIVKATIQDGVVTYEVARLPPAVTT